jgi:hypothetical protein
MHEEQCREVVDKAARPLFARAIRSASGKLSGKQAGFAKIKVRGCAKAEAASTFAVPAYNLIRIPKLLAQA